MQSQPLLSLLIRHEQTLYAQAQQSTACMAAHHVEARLCRWLLRSRDLSQSDTLLFTQEFLAEMLGVNRTSLTVVAQGVETKEQADFLRAHACDEIQGFYFNKPMSVPQFTALLEAQKPDPTLSGSRAAIAALTP